MKPELNLLVWAVALTVVQMLVAVQGAFNQVGLARLASNRDGWPEITGWGGRPARAHRNMLENLVLFAALVLVAGTGGKKKDKKPLGGASFHSTRPTDALDLIPRGHPLRPLGLVVLRCRP